MITYNNYREFSIGAKAQRLFIMREKGMNVPELVCVKSSDELKDLPFDRNGLYSVRSSADCEDGASMSFAGQFNTTLNVKGSELEKYVDESWFVTASLESRVSRVVKRDRMTRGEVMDRINSHMP